MKNLLLSAICAIISFSLTAQSDIVPPALDKPANAATNQMPDAQLDWYAVTGIGPVTYQVQIDTSDQFLTPIIYSTSFSAQKAENLMFGEKYYWRVNATDNSGTSGWSEIRDFTVFSFVALHKPDDEDTSKMPDVVLDWSNKKGSLFISGYTYYDLQVSPTDDFNNPSFIDSIPLGAFSSTASYYESQTSDLLFDTTYYWRVRVRHTVDTSDWSEVWSFSTIKTVIPNTPENGATGQNPDVVLSWEPMTGVVKFIYQICTDPNFTFPCITDFTEESSVTISSLLFGATYHWRVKAVHLLDTTDWSPDHNFQIINTVLLSSPADGATGQPSLPTLAWNTIVGADEYEVRWNSEDNTIKDTAITTTPSFNMFVPLDLGEKYFWKVRAINNVDTTDWSASWAFNTAQLGIDVNILSKDKIHLFPNPTNGDFYIELKSEKNMQIQVTILDFVGKTVFDKTCFYNDGLKVNEIKLDDLNSGLYFIRLKSGDAVYTEKLIIDK